MNINTPITDVLAYLNQRDTHQLLPIKIAFLRNITIEPIAPYLTYNLDKLGYDASYYFSSYNNVPQETIKAQSDFSEFNADITIIALHLEKLSPRLWWQFPQLTHTELNEEFEFILNNFKQIIKSIKETNKHSIIYIHNFPIITNPNFGILDLQSPSKQINTIRKLNIALADLTEQEKGVHLVDLDLLQSKIGHTHFSDNRYWYLSQAPFATQAYIALANEYATYCRSSFKPAKKCLVLDLDNTLWGGIIGEDGIDKIQLDHDYPGSVFRDLQKIFLNLYHRGILLAICSKNNLGDVLQVIEHHPNMILKKEHFVNIKANWESKSQNIQDIANELNIGLDSIVFIDDSDFEIALIRSTLPQVTSIQLKGEPSDFVTFISSFDLFDTLTISDEDKSRSKMYQSQLNRDKEKQEATDINSYYHSLNIRASVNLADSFSIPRIAQLTQKSNQFNLTTQRYTEIDIQNKISSQQEDVFYLKISDKFGEHGIVGVAIVQYTQEALIIESLLISCRVISYNAGNILLHQLIQAAKLKNKLFVIGKYKETPKNKITADFYIKNNFVQLGNDQHSCARFQYTITESDDILPSYVTIHN